ncbi:MAG TPA: hypothetical protein VM901_10875, partial [Bdellovibrionota bacterium]|nr:hypothetical protein [Bdellovibrionota bacterium]
MNAKIKSVLAGYWWVLPLLVLVIFSFVQAFVPEKPAYESKLETRIDLRIKLDTPSDESLPITSVLQGKLSATEEQSTQHRFVLLSMWAT